MPRESGSLWKNLEIVCTLLELNMHIPSVSGFWATCSHTTQDLCHHTIHCMTSTSTSPQLHTGQAQGSLQSMPAAWSLMFRMLHGASLQASAPYSRPSNHTSPELVNQTSDAETSLPHQSLVWACTCHVCCGWPIHLGHNGNLGPGSWDPLQTKIFSKM